MTRRIRVTGSSGQIGREVVAHLNAAGLPLGALSRNPEAVGLPGSVEVRRDAARQPTALSSR
jgi:uncharacterized protein YbjT (DUF2867 family)